MRRVIAIDFDGVLCRDAWPQIGEPDLEIIEEAIFEQKQGAALILWTCRCGELLDEAVAWCRERGLEFDAVNENLPERVAVYGSESRKISADEYWDDRAHGPFWIRERRRWRRDDEAAAGIGQAFSPDKDEGGQP